MKTLKPMNKWIALLLAAAFSIVGCQKKREAKLPYGADRDLMVISQYEGIDFELQTGEKEKASNSSDTIKVVDGRKKAEDQADQFHFVKYSSKDPLNLLDKTLMIGKVRTLYFSRYVFEDSLLKVMKVSKPENLSPDEIKVAVDVKNRPGFKMVPIVSYSISYFSMDTTRNELNEKTSKLEVVAKQEKGSATHFKIDLKSKTRASFQSKATVFDTQFFTGTKNSKDSYLDENGVDTRDFYYAFTVVTQNYNENRGPLGYLISSDKYGREASVIRARFFEDKVVFYNSGIDERLQGKLESRDDLQAAALSIPAEFVDFQMEEKGKETSVKEEKNKETSFEKRRSVDLKLINTKIPGLNLEITDIKDIQLDDGYFSFLVKSETFGGLVRISLLNASAYQKQQIKNGAQPYKKKIYFREDQNLFGFFQTHQESLDSFDRSKTSQQERYTFVNRFNPTRKMIEFRLNHDAPEWTEEIVKRAAAAWTATFKAAGSQTQIRVLDEKGKVLRGHPGDLRYSLINMYSDVDGAGGWGGLGPALADSKTGEIIMATSNMNLTTYLDGMESTLNHYLLSARGELDQKYILGLPLPSMQMIADSASMTLKSVGQKLGVSWFDKINYLDPKTNSFTKGIPSVYDSATRKFVTGFKAEEDKDKTQQKLTFSNQSQLEGRFELVNGNISDQVKEICPQLAKLGQQKEVSSDEDLVEIKKCARQLAMPIMIAVTLHEMGHNFGLRHNFYGSVDGPSQVLKKASGNFFAPTGVKIGNQEVKTQWASSTVMDYLPLSYENMTQPGLYDIAAIRWGYLDQIEAAHGKPVTVAPEKSTRSQIGQNYRPYKYCTDEHVDIVQNDPLCARHDIGVTPSEIIENHINGYDAHIALRNHRRGRDAELNMFSLAMTRLNYYVMPMKLIYDKWREILGNAAGNGQEYLERFSSPEAYEELVKKVTDPKLVCREIEKIDNSCPTARLNADYKKAADRYFNFLMYMAFVPDYSCIVTREKGDIQLYSFSKIQKILHANSGKTHTSCKDPEVREYLKATYGATLRAEGGYSFDNISSDISNPEVRLSSYRALERPEVVGIAQDRLIAMSLLTGRYRGLYINNRNGFFPSPMDEATKRGALINVTSYRLAEGALTNLLGIQTESVPSFDAEKPLLAEMVGLLKSGMFIPNKVNETAKNFDEFRVVPYYYVGDNTDSDSCATLYGMRWCAVKPDGMAAKLMQSYQQVQQMKFSAEAPENFEEELLKLVDDLVPEKFEDMKANFYFEIVDRVNKVSNPQLGQMIALIVNKVFSDELNIIQAGIRQKVEKVQNEDLSKKERDERLKAIKEISLKDLVERIGATEDYKTPMTKSVMRKRLAEIVKELKAQRQSYQMDKTEIDAKADILLQSITGGMSYY